MTATQQARKRSRKRSRGQGGGTPPTTTTPAGLLAGRYRVEELLGRGMAKQVHKGYDTFKTRDVAIGVFRWPGRETTKFIERYNLVRDCGPHANIADVIDAGAVEDARGDLRTFVVLELAEGMRPVDEVVRLHGGPLPLPQVLTYLHGVLSGLSHLHAHRIAHGACHSQNVMVDDTGHPLITDFDWCLPIGSTRVAPDKLVSIVGLHQVTPEELRGAPHDERADCYVAALGAYIVATGRLPYDTSDLPIIGDHSRDLLSRLDRLPETPLKLNPHLPQLVSDLLLKLLTPDPSCRFQNADEALQELERVSYPFHAPPLAFDLA